ncbi:MAG: hypothetical protein AAF414_20255 [Pseudomonadota bacterium]
MSPIKMKTVRRLSSLVLGATIVSLSTSALAQNGDVPCGQFDLYPRYVEVHFSDLGEEGVSLGDTRVGQIALVTEDETETAQFYFHSVVVPGGDEEFHNLLLTGHVVFADASIPVSFMYLRPNLTDSEPGPSEIESAVHGGTGSLTGTSGMLRLTRDDDRNRYYSFDLACPAG